ncbi:hypothetical protein OAE97_00050 [Verrucomicrobia bacterium]|nr:hypothetical protein [Verrucomicrobiota bacterium]
MASLVTTTINGTLTGNSSATFDSTIRSKNQLRVSNDYSVNYFYKTDNTTMLGYLLMRDDYESFLSFPAAQDFRILHGNTSRIAVKTDGNVGIGTTNPTEKLEITGNVRVMPSSGDVKIRLTDQGVRSWDLRVSDGSDYFEIDGTTSTSLVVTGAGNVGIGTTSPASKLQIVSSTSGDSVLKVDGTNGTLFEVVDDLSDSLMSVNDAAGLPVFEVFADNHIVAGRYNQNDFYLDTNGNLGLGTSTPSSVLDIYEQSGKDNKLRFHSSTTGSGTSNGSRIGLNGAELFINNIENNAIKIYTQSTQTNGITILGNGNVGIGTTLPDAKLTIKDPTNPPQIRLEDVDGGTQTAKIVFDQAGQNSLVLSTQYQSSTDLNLIQFAPADNVAMTIRGGTGTSDGFVGIGTTSPNYKLHTVGGAGVFDVIGASGLNNHLAVTEVATLPDWRPYAGTTTAALQLQSSATRGILLAAKSTGNQDFYNTDGLDIYVASTVGASSSDKGILAISILSGGNVGIGTPSPSAKLVVKAAISTVYANVAPSISDSIIAISNTQTSETTNDQAQIQFGVNGGTHNRIGSIGLIAESASSRKAALVFATDDAGTRAEKMRITGDGKVGIGTASPDAKLEVAGGSTGIMLSNLGDSSSYDGVNMTYSGYNSGTPEFIFQPTTTPGSGTVNSFFRFKNRSSVGSNIANVTVEGSVGIGTAIPTTRLQVKDSVDNTYESGFSVVRSADNSTTWINVRGGATNFNNKNHAGNAGLKYRWFQNGSEKMTLDTNGNLGIGIVPQAKFEVDLNQTNGTLAADNYAHFGGQHMSNGYVMGITLGYREANLLYRKVGIVARGLGDAHARQDLDFLVSTATGSTSVTPSDAKLTISGLTGNVGIGTTAPTGAKLQVAGGIRISDASKVYLYTSNDLNYLTYNRWQVHTSTALAIDNTSTGGFQVQDSGVPVLFVGTDSTYGGKVGIGTTSPAYTLQVQGTGYFSSNLLSSGLTVQTNSNYIRESSDQIRYLSRINGRNINHNAQFISGTTSGYSLYNNSGGSATSISVIYYTSDTAISTSAIPNSVGNVLKISYTSGVGSTSPGFGGFYLGTNNSETISADQKYKQKNRIIHRIWAKIPSGKTLAFASNAYGTSGSFTWLTPTGGNGDWYEYIGVQQIGYGGSFSSTSYFYVSGGSNASFNWYVAECSLIDVDCPSDILYSPGLSIGYASGDSYNSVQAGWGGLGVKNNAIIGGNVGVGNTISQAYTNEGARTVKLRVGSDTLSSNQSSAIQIGGYDSSGSGTLGAIEFFNHRDDSIAAKMQVRRDLESGDKLSAGQLDFYTDDGDNNLNLQMSIDALGNVGIGTASPGHGFTVYKSSGADNTPIAWIHNSGNFANYDGTVISSVNNGSDAEVLHVRTNNTTYNGGTSLMLVRGDGHVGIGTPSPGYKLDVDGTVAADTYGFRSDSTAKWYHFDTFSGNNFIGRGSNAYTSLYDTGTLSMVWKNGKVGIGTNNPSYKLHVFGSGFTESSLNLQRTDAGTHNDPNIIFTANSSANTSVALGGLWYQNAVDNNYNAIIRARTDNNAGTSGRLDFVTGIAVGNSTVPSMVIKGDGNVGIGTTSPGSKLHVNGGSKYFGGGDWTTIERVTTTEGNYALYVQTTGTNTNQAIAKFNYGCTAGGANTGTTVAAIAREKSYFLSKLGIGTIVPQTKLHIDTGSSIGTIDSAYSLAIRGDGIDGIQILSDSAYSGRIVFGDQNSNTAGQIRYDHSTDAFRIFTNGAEKVSILSGGNVGIGTVSPTSKLQIVGSTSGDSALRVDGTSGTIFEVTDDLSGSLMSVNTIAGLPVFEVFADNTIIGGRYNQNDFYLNTNGNLGLGTSSPITRLNIKGDQSADGQLYIEPTNDSEYAGLVIKTTRGADRAYAIFAGGTGTDDLNFRFRDASAGVDRMVIDSAGNVGIGTDGPEGKLHIYTGNSGGTVNSSADELVIEAAATGGIQLLNGTTSSGYILFGDSDANSIGQIRYLHSDNSMRLTTANVERLIIDAGGKVGIGTASPSQKLHVVGKALITDDVQLTGSSPRIDFNTNGSSSLRFYDTTNAAERMRINTSGNLGINTTSPTSKLQVVGSTSGDSVLKVDGTNGTLFEVVDDLSDSLMSVNDAAGLPVFEVFADNHIVAGRYNQNDFYLDTNGYVGIGTGSPSSRLHLVSNVAVGNIFEIDNQAGNQVLRVSQASTLTALSMSDQNGAFKCGLTASSSLGGGILLNDTSGATYLTSFASVGTVFNESGSAIDFRIEGDTDSSLFFVDGSADTVGIGTSSPSYKLHVVGTAHTTGNFSVGNGGNGGGVSISPGGQTAAYALTVDRSGSAGSSVDIWDYNSNSVVIGATSSEKTLTVKAGGWVGIGATNPAYGLDNNRTSVRTNSYTAEKVFGVSFPNSTANQKVDISFPYFNGTMFWGYLEVTITATYSNQLSTGKLTKVFSVGLNVPGGTSGNYTSQIYDNTNYYTSVYGALSSQWGIEGINFNTTTGQYYITIAHRVSTGNGIRVSVKAYGYSPDYLASNRFGGITAGSVYTTDATVFDTPVKEVTNLKAHGSVDITSSIGIGSTLATNRVVTIGNTAGTDRPAIKIITPNFSSSTSSTGKAFYRWMPIDIDGTTRWIAIYS